MRIVTCFCVTALFLMSLATPRLASAEASKPSAHGNVQVSVGDDVTRDVKFDVKTEEDGTIQGDITLTDPSATADLDPDNPDASHDPSLGLSVQVEADCLVVHENRAAMSGVIVDSNDPTRIGQRVLLTVEDNGEGSQAEPDRLTWGVYEDLTRSWTPSDAELPGDTGASLTWIATDAERTDDVGIPSNQSQGVDCNSFPLLSYALVAAQPVVDVEHGDGNIQVKP